MPQTNHNRSAHKNNQPPPEKPLPRAPDAERFVLGSILQDYRTHGHIVDRLSPHDFPVERDRQILSAIVRLRARDEAIDRETVRDELDQAGHLANVTLAYLYELTEGMPLVPNVDSYVRIVNEKTAQRRLMEHGQHLLNQGATGFSSAEIVESTQRLIDDVVKRTITKPSIRVLTGKELIASRTERPSMALDGLLEKNALNMTYGAPRDGKTLLTSQIAIAIADGQKSLFDKYAINIEGPVMFIQPDDQNNGASLADILEKSPIPISETFHYPEKFSLTLGDEFYDWLEYEIKSRGLVFVALDSYTTLRAPRHGGSDIVKAEQEELRALADLAQRTSCTFDLIHHESQSSKRNSSHWTERAGGTFAVQATPAMHIHVSRFRDLDDNAPERLVRARGRHTEGETFAMRFRKEKLDHELILTGSAAEFYPLLERLKSEFPGNKVFKPKDVVAVTGVSRQTATRQIETLRRAGLITRLRHGEYMV